MCRLAINLFERVCENSYLKLFLEWIPEWIKKNFSPKTATAKWYNKCKFKYAQSAKAK